MREVAALAKACDVVGLDPREAVLLHRHATTVYHLPRAGAVARIAPADHSEPARLSVTVTRWLHVEGFPVTVALDVEQPVVAADHVVTFWRYHPQGERGLPPVRELARLLRRLHNLRSLPFPLPEYEPLCGFRAALAAYGPTVLEPEAHEFLCRRADEVLATYQGLRSELGYGVIHGDPRAGNLLWDGDRVILGDWDSVSYGPREVDLVIAYQGVRYGRSEQVLDEFATIYGWDIRTWPGYDVLYDMRDLHTLSAPLRLAAHRTDVAAELHHRISSLQAGDRTQRWRSF